MRRLLAIALAGVALLAAGCGGSGGGSGSSASADSAPSLAPKDAGLLISVDTDRGSAQWQALDGVLARVPGAQGVLDSALAQVGPKNAKLDFDRDVRPALGKQAVIVLPAGAAYPLLLVKPDDGAKLDALLRTSSTPYVKGEHDGWTVVGRTQKAIDGYAAAVGKGTLGDSDAYAKASDGLPKEALIRVYADGNGLQGAAGTATGAASGALKNVSVPVLGNVSQSGAGVDPATLAKLGIVGFTVSAGDGIVRFDGSWQPAAGASPAAYTPTLLQKVPADALAAVSFGGSKAAAGQLQTALAGAGAAQLQQVEQALGVSLPDLVGALDGQGVAYVRPGLIVPEVTVVLQPSDPARALQTLDTALTKLAATSGGKVTETTQAGVQWKQVNVQIVTVAWGRDGDRVVVTTVPQGVEAFDGADAKLVDAQRFKTAAGDVGLGDQTTGFAYVDVKGLVPLVKTIAAAAGSGSGPDPSVDKAVQALSALDTVALNASADGKLYRFQGAVRTVAK